MLDTCPASFSPSILLNPPNSPPRIIRNSIPLRSVRFNTRLASMRIRLWFLAALVLSHALSSAVGYSRRGGRYGEEGEEEYEGHEWGGRGGGGRGGGGGGRRRGGSEEEGEDLFLLQNSKQVIQTDAGEMKVVMTFGGRMVDRPMHIGFITMEPQTLFIPQYLDSSLILFVRRGEARIGLIHRDRLVERRLKMGDVYRIPAGSAFYMVNTGEGQRLHVICSIDRSESLGLRTFQSFFIGGGMYPTSVLTGFDPDTLATAFNVTTDEIRDFLTRQQEGPIVYVTGNASSYEQQPSVWSKFLNLKDEYKLQHLKRMVEFQEEDEEEAGQKPWSWRKLLLSFFEPENAGGDWGTKKWTGSKGPDSYNLFDRKPDFRNDYGWSVALDESDYEPLKHSGIGVFLVNLTAGSMMAPHVNPTATEYGIVLSGSGTIQIGYPNGSAALNTKVREGDIFWIPRFFPFCQIASRSAPFEFFGFTTSARRNRPQFLVGQNSMLHALRGPELSAAFGTTDDEFQTLLDSQREAVILPTASVAPPDETLRKKKKKHV